jgi:hypothetical protein
MAVLRCAAPPVADRLNPADQPAPACQLSQRAALTATRCATVYGDQLLATALSRGLCMHSHTGATHAVHHVDTTSCAAHRAFWAVVGHLWWRSYCVARSVPAWRTSWALTRPEQRCDL